MKKSILSAFLALVLTFTVFAALPTSAFAATSGDFTYTVGEDGRVTITDYTGTDAVVTVPATIDGKAVYAIGENAMSKKTFEEVIISEGIEVLESYSFEYNFSLTNIQLPDSLTKIGTMSFNACSELTELYIPKNVNNVESHIVWFSGIENITVDEANEHLKSVDGILYTKDNKRLLAYPPAKVSEVTVLDGTEEIFDAAFMNSKVTAVSFPASLRSIAYQAFSGCSSLTSVTFAAGPAVIGNYVFSKCTALTELVIPEGCVELKSFIVKDCDALTSLTLPSSVTTVAERTFSNAPRGLTVYTPVPGVVSEAAESAGLTVVLTGMDAVNDVIAQIDAMDEVTSLAQEADIAAVRAAYDALLPAQQELVTNADKLTESEAAIEALKQPAYDVISMINALGAITSTEQKPQVEAARAAYDALSDETKPLVVNYALLTSAEEIIAALERGEVLPGYLLGDVDGSGKLDVADILKIKNIIMNEENDEQLLMVADIDASGTIDVADILSLKNIIMAS